MKRMINSSTENYTDYDVVVSFGGYIGAEQEITVVAKEGATEDDILAVICDEYVDELLYAEILDYDEDNESYRVEVNFASYIGVSEIYEEFADNEEDAMDYAINEASDELQIESFKVSA